ncbi:hypothetical protein [Endozoicomonas sp. SESOKO1]|uniref:hypothetical protein n=1 Tax=Endozoicomonas sp. SESOKO1 TaxID=2828742 RepID=UPI002148365A|nr:hypothetical protein [Endozoicomonas sp. SESOKO1]
MKVKAKTKALVALSLLALVGCSTPSQKAERQALKALHKAEQKVAVGTVITGVGAAVTAKGTAIVVEGSKERKEAESQLLDTLGVKEE